MQKSCVYTKIFKDFLLDDSIECYIVDCSACHSLKTHHSMRSARPLPHPASTALSLEPLYSPSDSRYFRATSTPSSTLSGLVP